MTHAALIRASAALLMASTALTAVLAVVYSLSGMVQVSNRLEGAPLADTPVLHWHGDTFDLPDGCTLLASSGSYRNQAFARGTTLLALQCHPEMGEDPRITRWIDAGADDMAAAGTTADAVRADYATKGPAAVAAGRAMLAEWLAGLPPV